MPQQTNCAVLHAVYYENCFQIYIAKEYTVIYVVSKVCLKIHFYFDADFFFKGNYKVKQEKI